MELRRAFIFSRDLALAALLAIAGAGLQVQAQSLPDPQTAQIAGDLPAASPGKIAQTADIAAPDGVTPILTIDRDALYVGSAWGARATAQLEAESKEIAAENERLVKQLSDEEAALAEQRKSLDPEEFARRAEAFDLRATEVRRARAKVLEDLSAQTEADQRAFFQAAIPIIGEIMQSRGAVAVLDRRIMIMSAPAADITAEVIAAVDAKIGDRPPTEAAGAVQDTSDTAPTPPDQRN